MLRQTYVDVVIAVVVEIKDPKQFGVVAHVNLFGVLDAFAEGLSRVLFHLDVIEFSGDQNKEQIVR